VFLSARKKMEEKDYTGAKKDLQQIPASTVIAAKAKALIAEINGIESSEVKEMRQHAAERLGLVDGGLEAAAAPARKRPPRRPTPPRPLPSLARCVDDSG
jgi:hypothetical protein